MLELFNKEEFNFNALSLYGTGRNTPMNHVWIDNVLHDGIELRGGNIELDQVVVTRAQQNALKIKTNWAGHGEQLFLHHNGNYGIHMQDPSMATSVSSSFSLSQLSVVDASAAAIAVTSRLSSATFDRFYWSDTPLGVDFVSAFSTISPFQWSNIYLENVQSISNNALFNEQFEVSDTLPFAQANQLPAWLSMWEN